MKYRINCLLLLLVMLSLCACNDWLDVKPETQMERDKFYSAEDGFRSALVGCYMKMRGRQLYGEQLTMSNLEFMAQHWIPSGTQEELMNFQWDTKASESILKSWYLGLYKVIAQANDLLENLDKNGKVITDVKRRQMIRGEALAIRAFCHLDILRLFGQLPDPDTLTRNLPYSEKTGNEPVKFVDFETYTSKIARDFEAAADLLKQSDPVLHYTWNQLNQPAESIEEGYISDHFDAYRRIRFNYWAVKAFQARAYLYMGDRENAYWCAKEVIDAQIDGQPVNQLSCQADYTAGYYILPNEVLAGLNIFDISNYISPLFNSGGSVLNKADNKTFILRDIFQNQSSDYRITYVWDNVQGDKKQRWTVKKYRQSSEAGSSAVVDMNRQMVPLIRLPEVYLIAVEAAPNLDEANRLLREFKDSRNLEYTDQNWDQIRTDLLQEYRKEFYAEGQMFFAYKRLGEQSMLWHTGRVTEADYVLPIPRTEVEY